MKISVIIPTYRPQKYLIQCLDSICNQEFSKDEYEVLLILNGCCEPFNSVILEYIKEHPLILWKYIQTDVSGVSNARNLGIEAAKGEYIAFVDDDDYISPSYLSELYSLSNETTIALSYELAFKDGTNDYYKYYISKEFEKYKDNDVLPFYKARRLFNGPVYKLIPKSLIGERRFDISLENGEDALFMFLISDKFKDVSFTSQNAVYYRRYRKGSAISLRGNKVQRINNALRLIIKYFVIYLKHPFSYNIYFMLSRIVGTLKTIH